MGIKYYTPTFPKCNVKNRLTRLKQDGTRQPRAENWVLSKINMNRNGYGPIGARIY